MVAALPSLPASPDPPQASENESEEVEAGMARGEKHKRPRHQERPQTSGRQKRATCPECGLQVVHLPRQLRTNQRRKPILGYQRTQKGAVTNMIAYMLKACPLRGCHSVTARLDIHLNRIHGMARRPNIHRLVMSARRGLSIEQEESDEEAEGEAEAEAELEEANTGSSWKEHPMIRSFFKWMCSLEKNRSERVARQHCNQVFIVWSTIDQTMDLASIQNTIWIKDQWLTPARAKLAPGTIRSYLGSLQDFFSFMADEDIVNSEQATRGAQKLRRWAKSLHLDKKRRVEQRVKDDEGRIETADIVKYRESEVYRLARDTFEREETQEQDGYIPEREFLLCKNFLILNTLIRNGQRAGSVANFTMGALRKSEEHEDEHVVTISKHKTGYISPVTLFFSLELWRYLGIFTTMMRKRLTGYCSELAREESAVFTTYPGPSGQPGAMTSSLINKAVKSIWKAAEVTKELSITDLRKAAATKVRSKFPWARDALAQQMTHRATTQDQYFILQQKKKDSAKVVKLIERVMTEDESTMEVCPGPGDFLKVLEVGRTSVPQSEFRASVTRYDINPPQYSQTVEPGHQSLKPPEGPLPLRYSDIINTSSDVTLSQGAVDNPAFTTNDETFTEQNLELRTDSSDIAVSEMSCEIQEDNMKGPTNEKNCKQDKNTPTHDKAGLIDNEVENCDN